MQIFRNVRKNWVPISFAYASKRNLIILYYWDFPIAAINNYWIIIIPWTFRNYIGTYNNKNSIAISKFKVRLMAKFHWGLILIRKGQLLNGRQETVDHHWLIVMRIYQDCQPRKWKKSLAQEVRQKGDISERRSKGWKGPPLQPLLCLQHVQLCHCATCQGPSYPKNEYSPFYQKFDAEYFFIRQFCRKKLDFQRKPRKTVLGAHLTIF